MARSKITPPISNPRQNPFRNDRFDIQRLGGALTHEWRGDGRRLVTTLYGHSIQRDWWRQSSNSAQRPNDAADPACNGIAETELLVVFFTGLRSLRGPLFGVVFVDVHAVLVLKLAVLLLVLVKLLALRLLAKLAHRREVGTGRVEALHVGSHPVVCNLALELA